MKNNFFCLLFLTLFTPFFSIAFSTSSIPNTPIDGSFKIVGTSKINISSIKPGERTEAVIRVLNQSGFTAKFSVEKEKDERMPDAYGKYFLDLTKIDKDNFILKHGEQAEIGLSVEIPSDFSAEDEIGGVIFVSSQKMEDIDGAGTKIVVRLPSIVSIKIDGIEKNVIHSVIDKNLDNQNISFRYIMLSIFVIILTLYFFKRWSR